MAHVRLEGITKKFGSHAAVSDLDLGELTEFTRLYQMRSATPSS